MPSIDERKKLADPEGFEPPVYSLEGSPEPSPSSLRSAPGCPPHAPITGAGYLILRGDSPKDCGRPCLLSPPRVKSCPAIWARCEHGLFAIEHNNNRMLHISANGDIRIIVCCGRHSTAWVVTLDCSHNLDSRPEQLFHTWKIYRFLLAIQSHVCFALTASVPYKVILHRFVLAWVDGVHSPTSTPSIFSTALQCDSSGSGRGM